jgi:hypothetical protein
MSELDGLNGKARGEEYARRIDAYLNSISELPLLKGSINVTAIAEAAGIPTQSVYKNQTVHELLEAAKVRFGVKSWGENAASTARADKAETASPPTSDAKMRRLGKQLSDLEQRYSAVVAENYELRHQLKELQLQLEREDMMIESGRRIAAPRLE